MSRLTEALWEVEGKSYVTRRGFIINGKFLYIGVIHDELFSWKEFDPILKGDDWRKYCVENKEDIIRFDLSGYCSAFEFFAEPSKDTLKLCAGLANEIVTVALHYGNSADANNIERAIDKIRGRYAK